VVCFSRIWSVPCEAWRTGSLRSHCRRASAREAASSKLRSTVVDRDTSDRPLPPYQPVYLHPRSWLSSYLSSRGLRPGRDGSRDTTFHDVVARFRRIVRNGPRMFAGVASCDLTSDTPVARPWCHAALAGDCDTERLSRDPPSPRLREEAWREDDPVCLPPVGRSGYRAPGRSRSRALRRGCDPVNVHEVVRPAIASSSRAPGRARHLAVPCASGIVTLDQSPRRPACWNDAVRASCRAPECRNTREFQAGFCGLAAAYRSLQRMFDARARPRAVNPPPREAPASVRVRGAACADPIPLAKDPPPRSPAPGVSARHEIRSSGAVASHRPGRARPGFEAGREMTPRSHAV
jgi:hypothetical protein